MNKRGVSEVITSVLIIIIVIIAISIIAFIIFGFVNSNKEKISTGLLLNNLEIIDNSPSYILQSDLVTIKLKRDSTEGNITGAKFIFTNSKGETYSYIVKQDILEQETKDFLIQLNGKISNPNKVEIAPIITINNKDKVLRVTDEATISTSTPECTSNADCQDNGNFCDGTESCNLLTSQCQSSGNPCNDGISCTTDSCNEATNSCSNVPTNSLCDDGNMCNGINYCDINLGCQDGTPINCNDGISCTADSCNPLNGQCTNNPDNLQCNAGETCSTTLGCISNLLSAGPKYPGTILSVAPGNVQWSNPINAQIDDSIESISNLDQDELSYFLQGTNFGFNIPTGATIQGIKLDLRKYAGGGSGNKGDIVDNEVMLIVGGVKQGDNKKILDPWSTRSGMGWTSYGNSSDIWGLSLTPAQINSNNFGIAVRVINIDDPGTSTSANIDAINMTVYYTIP